MEQMELKPYVKDNQLSLSLLRFHVKINILSNSRCIYHQLCLLFFGNLPRRDPECSHRAGGSRTGPGYDQIPDLFPGQASADDQKDRTAHVK